MGGLGSWRRAVELFRDPVTPEKRAILARRWEALDASLRLPTQTLGTKVTGCGGTIGIQPRCDFACTGCYLGQEANSVPALSLEAVLDQLDALRRHLGPKSNVQITDGEVTLRPADELTAILRHARTLGIVPMVMTHGDTFRRRAGLLERLMVEGGLTEVSVHIDITQRGRDGYRAPVSETELMPLREEFAELVRTARKTTGKPLRAAMTLTVTRQNLPQIAEVVRWVIAHRDAFGLVSFQPLAQVGRTRRSQEGVGSEELWTEIGRATSAFGASLSAGRDDDPVLFGHPDCTRVVNFLAIERSGEPPRLLPLIRARPEDAAILAGFLRTGTAGAAFRDDPPLEKAARMAGFLTGAAGFFLGPARRWIGARLREEAGTTIAGLLRDRLLGRVRLDGLSLTSHHFMSPEQAASERGRERLAACVFKVPYRDEMVPMCAMNAAGLREKMYALIPRPAPHTAASGSSSALMARRGTAPS